MADLYITSPRRGDVKVTLHPGEVTHIFRQLFIERFTKEELLEIIENCHNEVNRRENENVLAETK